MLYKRLLLFQGVGILLTEDGTVYEGELTTGPTLSGKVTTLSTNVLNLNTFMSV